MRSLRVFGVFEVFVLIMHIPVVAEGFVTNIIGTFASVVTLPIVIVGILVLVAVVLLIVFVVVGGGGVVVGVVFGVVDVVVGGGLMVVVVTVVVPKTRLSIFSSCS
jgi:hypothetical protein